MSGTPTACCSSGTTTVAWNYYCCQGLLRSQPLIHAGSLLLLPVVQHAGMAALRRDVAGTAGTGFLRTAASGSSGVVSVVSVEDLHAALATVTPSAMREVVVEVPTVRWSDIGGQQLVKARLKEAVEWPLHRPELFKTMGIRPPKGVLLYGPPGCSKALMAKAVATER